MCNENVLADFAEGSNKAIRPHVQVLVVTLFNARGKNTQHIDDVLWITFL